MQTNILWTGREYYSLENCRIEVTEIGAWVESTIVGKYGEDLYQVNYQLRTNENWATVLLDLNFYKNNDFRQLRLEGDGEGDWFFNGESHTAFTGCIDIDLPLTPFTNTLPIKRLHLQQGKEQTIKVVYLDLLNDDFKAVSQKYRRVSDTVYLYENVPNDFEADIVVDPDGLVVDYPELFVRTARQHF